MNKLLLSAVLLSCCTSESVRARRPGEDILQQRLHQILSPSSGQYNPLLASLESAARRPRHMNLGLSDRDVADEDSPLLLHLKDQGLWDKENGLAADFARRSGVKSSYIEALLTHLHQSAENNRADEHYEDEVPAVYHNSNLNHVPTLHLYQDTVGKEENMKDVKTDDDESVKETSNSDSGPPRSSMYFNMMDAFKNLYTKSMSNIETEAPEVVDPVAQDNAGMFFNLDTLGRQLKEKYNGVINGQSGDKPGMALNLVEMLERYVDKKLEKSTKGSLPDIPRESDSAAATSDNAFQD